MLIAMICETGKAFINDVAKTKYRPRPLTENILGWNELEGNPAAATMIAAVIVAPQKTEESHL